MEKDFLQYFTLLTYLACKTSVHYYKLHIHFIYSIIHYYTLLYTSYTLIYTTIHSYTLLAYFIEELLI